MHKLDNGTAAANTFTISTDRTTAPVYINFNTLPQLTFIHTEPRRIFKCDRGHRYETCDRWQPPMYLGGKCWKCWDEALGNVEEVKECSC